MSSPASNLCIVFADICESTQLYESLGDEMARDFVARGLEIMTEQVEKYGGKVIKTIGDEIMCTFPAVEYGVEGAMSMQEAVTEDVPSIHAKRAKRMTMNIRIGLQFGPVILEGGDVFGDAVNVASRMCQLAKGGQILTTQQTAEALPPALRTSTRHLDRIQVRGKSEEVDLYEVLWQHEDVTRMATGLIENAERKPVQLTLYYHGHVVAVDSNSPPTILGRGKRADLVIHDTMASREHARIECRRDKFVLTDQSTNGTYVVTPDGPAYLRREDITLSGEGRIALGRDINDATEVVTYRCEP